MQSSVRAGDDSRRCLVRDAQRTAVLITPDAQQTGWPQTLFRSGKYRWRRAMQCQPPTASVAGLRVEWPWSRRRPSNRLRFLILAGAWSVFLVILPVFSLIFVIIVIIRRRQIYGVQEHAGHVSIDLHQYIPSAAECLFRRLTGANHQDRCVST